MEREERTRQWGEARVMVERERLDKAVQGGQEVQLDKAVQGGQEAQLDTAVRRGQVEAQEPV